MGLRSTLGQGTAPDRKGGMNGISSITTFELVKLANRSRFSQTVNTLATFTVGTGKTPPAFNNRQRTCRSPSTDFPTAPSEGSKFQRPVVPRSYRWHSTESDLV